MVVVYHLNALRRMRKKIKAASNARKISMIASEMQFGIANHVINEALTHY